MDKDEIVSEKKTAGEEKATVSLILGILSIVLSLFGSNIGGIILAIVGIVFADSAKKKGCDNNKGSATAGLVLSIIGLVISVLFLSFILVFAGRLRFFTRIWY